MVTQTYVIEKGKVVSTTWVEATPTGAVEMTQTFTPTGAVAGTTVQPIGEPTPAEPKVETIKRIGETPAGGVIIEREGVKETIPPKKWEAMRREYYATMPPEEKERQRMETVKAISQAPVVEVAGKPYTWRQWRERETEAMRRAKEPTAQFMYSISKPISILGAAISLPLVGKGGVESVQRLWQEEQLSIQKTLIYEPEKRWGMAFERVVEPAMIGVGAGVSQLAPMLAPFVPAKAAGVATLGISAGILGVSTFQFVGAVPKAISPEITVERGKAIERMGVGITGMALGAYGIKKSFEALIPRPEMVEREILAVSEEEIIPKGTVKRMKGYAIAKPKREIWFEPIPKREMIPEKLFTKGKVIAERGFLEVIKFDERYWLVSKMPTGKGVLPKDLVDVLKIQKKHFGKFPGLDIYARKTVKIPVTFETPEPYKLQIYKSPGRGWGAYRKLPISKQVKLSDKIISETFTGTQQITKGAIKYSPVSIKTTAMLRPPSVYPSAFVSPIAVPKMKQVAKFREYPIQTVFPKQWEYKLPTVSPLKVKIPSVMKTKTPIITPFITPARITSPITTPITTPFVTTAPSQAQLTRQMQRLTTQFTTPTLTLTTPKITLLPPAIPMWLPSGLFRRRRGRKMIPTIQPKGYRPSIGAVLMGIKGRPPKRYGGYLLGIEERPIPIFGRRKRRKKMAKRKRKRKRKKKKR